MTVDQTPYPDPLIDEVRQRRRELFAKCNGDLDRLWDAIRKWTL